VVIPAFNEEKNIGECLDAVLKSSYPKKKLEVIVVDDGSTDTTPELVASHAGVKLLRQNHLGKVEALNLGVAKSKHDIIFAIDADTTINKDCIKELVKPFKDPCIGATTGSCGVSNKHSLLGAFQNIEYFYNNLIRKCFSSVFTNGIWFFGALACYRKKALEKIGFFKKDTLTEDMDTALELHKAGYNVVNVYKANGKTIVPASFKGFYAQRMRWWAGVLQSLVKNRELFSIRSCPSIMFLFINQFWWSFYAILSMPLIAYQVYYWLPYNTGSLFSFSSYIFRWFSILGPFYVIYKLKEWGLNIYNFFGVMSGIISTFFIVSALRTFKERLSMKNAFAIFFKGEIINASN
jgi:cellulose synthase/poly-beta-1,6-N-acetylglucosamine synthase-like glycosyltransferase